MEVRLANTDDTEDLTRLFRGFRDHYGQPTPDDAGIEAAIPRLLESSDAEFLLAGEPPVGVALVRYRYSLWTGSDDAWLEDLFVEEPSRGQGLGKALVEACAERARERGCDRIQLDTNETNERGLGLYLSVGFVTDKMGIGGRDLYLTRWLR